MPPFEIRAACADDADAIRELTVQGAPGVSLFEENELEWLMQNASVWIAQMQTRVMGYVIAVASDVSYAGEEFAWFQKHAGAFLYIDRVAIAQDARGQGIGKALYAHVEACAHALGADALVCEVNVNPPNPASLAFHRALGFEQIGTMQTRDGRQVVLLRKHLEIAHE